MCEHVDMREMYKNSKRDLHFVKSKDFVKQSRWQLYRFSAIFSRDLSFFLPSGFQFSDPICRNDTYKLCDIFSTERIYTQYYCFKQ